MSMEYCETCDKDCHTDDGTWLITQARLYGDNPEPESQTFMCGRCYEKALMEYQSMQAAQYEYGRAKMRGY